MLVVVVVVLVLLLLLRVVPRTRDHMRMSTNCARVYSFFLLLIVTDMSVGHPTVQKFSHIPLRLSQLSEKTKKKE